MILNPSNSMQLSTIPITLPITNSSLDSSVSIDIPKQATAMLVQCIDQDVHFRLGVGSVTPLVATTDDFFICADNHMPVIIPVPPGGKVAFIENAATATLIYAFLR